VRKAKRLPLEVLAPYLLEPPATPIPLDWSIVFGNENPVELEIGFGKGAFLVAAGQANPQINYVGVEIDRGLQLYVANRIAKRELHNVRLAKADARFFIRDYVSPASLQAIHVYFPDPWWKQRHKKRRVFTPEFAVQCERILASGGQLHLATDVEEYFGVMTALVKEHTRLQEIDLSSNPGDDDFMTNFERKAQLQGRQTWRTVFKKN
jgi:tRNA (guanine-N7-)-methyltransferase